MKNALFAYAFLAFAGVVWSTGETAANAAPMQTPASQQVEAAGGPPLLQQTQRGRRTGRPGGRRIPVLSLNQR